MPDAVLLEWEGVIADTSAARRDALVRALEEERVPIASVRYDPAWSEIPLRDAAAAALRSAGRDDPVLIDLVVLRAARAYGLRLGTGVSLRPGAREFVERLQARSAVGIVTRAGRSETELFLRLADLEAAVSTVVCVDDLGEDAAPTACYERALEQLGRRRAVQRGRVVALGGAPEAMRAARAAGIRVVAVGLPAHAALEADGSVDGLDGLTAAQLVAAAGLSSTERHA